MSTTWLEGVTEQLWGVLDAFRSEVQERGLLPMLEPVAPFNRPAFAAPAVTLGGLLALLLLSGVAITALGAFLTALLALCVLLVQVFGFSLEMHPFGGR
jgi:hypothetical protein